jgi:hypothetical protein
LCATNVTDSLNAGVHDPNICTQMYGPKNNLIAYSEKNMLSHTGFDNSAYAVVNAVACIKSLQQYVALQPSSSKFSNAYETYRVDTTLRNSTVHPVCIEPGLRVLVCNLNDIQLRNRITEKVSGLVASDPLQRVCLITTAMGKCNDRSRLQVKQPYIHPIHSTEMPCEHEKYTEKAVEKPLEKPLEKALDIPVKKTLEKPLELEMHTPDNTAQINAMERANDAKKIRRAQKRETN